ncbi:unnamed protein product [Closterium sp. Naga37s-1]|nr:unnamed protein product [Closterium sp. Naga37s-1]
MACIQAVASLPSRVSLSLPAASSGQRSVVVRPIRSQRLVAVCAARSPKSTDAAPARRPSSAPFRLLSAPVAALPLVLAFVEAELPNAMDTFTALSDFHITEPAFKAFYMIFTCVFCWGALVFGSMNDEYYESDEYRNAGGNGTQFWIYQRVSRRAMPQLLLTHGGCWHKRGEGGLGGGGRGRRIWPGMFHTRDVGTQGEPPFPLCCPLLCCRSTPCLPRCPPPLSSPTVLPRCPPPLSSPAVLPRCPPPLSSPAVLPRCPPPLSFPAVLPRCPPPLSFPAVLPRCPPLPSHQFIPALLQAEEEEEGGREELWREELRREIEEKVTEVKGLKGAVREEELV